MKSIPHPITWYQIDAEDLPIFGKRPGATVFIMSEGGTHVVQVDRPRRVILPLFEIQELDTFETLHTMITSLSPTPANGYLYGVVRSNASSLWQHGLCFSFEELQPLFQDTTRVPGIVRELTPTQCFELHLPWSKVDPPYNGPRPTRFEREWVI
jgi:hypothetical protein